MHAVTSDSHLIVDVYTNNRVCSVTIVSTHARQLQLWPPTVMALPEQLQQRLSTVRALPEQLQHWVV